ncbi:Eukaryotic initiation factor [Parasponia andersonii]|uniref:Eukaryotic initiation factor n=1 Tax=Parasponia andersonii TaxID=3476 RepID=A0A2P5C1Y6_PARAD|nr:Eukaryotic initiation factor [Parasponia andersonii]
MAATVSPWAKPGAWALDSEEHEAELLKEQENKKDTLDFPSLTTAAAAKSKKKNKGQTLSLAEFTTYNGPTRSPAQPTEPVGLTHEDRLVLPKGPRERTAEELDRPRGGFRSFGDRGNNRYPDRNGDESSNSRWGHSKGPDRNGSGFGKDVNRDSGPSRADEVDNWASTKKSFVGNNGFERRERERSGFFSDSQSKADESDNWVSNKSFVPPEGRRNGGGFERERKVGFPSNGGGADADYWGKKKESNGGNENGSVNSVGGRPRLNLQPRTLPVSNESSPGSGAVAKPKGSSPFGEARPREEVLAEKGQDWKKIDEQLDSVKIKEVNEKADGGGSSIGKKSFGIGNDRYSSPNDRAEKSWRKPDTENATEDATGSQSTDQNEDAHEDGPAEEN